MVKLVYSDQQGRERVIEVGPQRSMISIGRNPDCHIQTNNASVSRVHAMVTWQDGRVFVQDPPSGRPTNGTYVDGMRLQAGELLELCPNSEMKCGNFLIRVIDDEGTAMTRPATGGPGVGRVGQVGFGPNQTGQVNHGMPASAYVAPNFGGPTPNPNISAPLQGGAGPMGQQMMNPGGAKLGSPEVMSSVYPNASQASAQPKAYPQGRAGQSSQQMQNPGIMQAVMGVNPEEHNRLIDELNTTRKELETLRAEKLSNDESMRQLKESLEERERALTDFEHRTDHHDTVVDSLNDMIKHLKEQLEHQKDQLQENKREIVSLEEQNENLDYELSALKQTLESKGMATSNAETTIANLKVQLTQKNRHLTEIQRELDLTQYAVKEERENVERLQSNIEMLNGNLEESERHCRDMKKVVEQHEAMFGELRSQIEERNSELRQLQATLRNKGGDSGALLADLASARDEAARRQRECENLKEQLKAAEAHISSIGSGDASDSGELSNLQSRISELESEQGALIKERGELESKLKELSLQGDEIASLKHDLEEARSTSQEPSDLGEELKAQIKKIYDIVNDSVSQWRDNLSAVESLINDLQRVFRYFMRIDLGLLPENDRVRLESTLKEFDPRIIFEEVANLLEADQGSFGDIKESLRELRSLLQ